VYEDNENRLKAVEDRLTKIEETLRSVTGSPILKAWNGVRLDLNADLDVAALNKELVNIHKRISALGNANGGL